ncbi:MAG TPA: peptidoglycan DD-metalloendopeptidase family protein [Gaiellaceae bacterium]|nr:peptidoglycan DD-metalloendopeptidase family protein [Gaiellaceae bacterium]
MRSGVCVLVLLVVGVLAGSARADEPATTTAATTTTATTATTESATSYAPLGASTLSRCAGAGAAAIVVPGKVPLVVGRAPADLGASAYPVADPVVSFDSADAGGRSCKPGGVAIRSLSLFGGAVTADSVTATGGRGTVTGLEVDGNPVQLRLGESTTVGAWGLLVGGEWIDKRLSAPLVLHLLEPRGALPAGTILLIGFGAKPAPAAKAKPAATPKPAVAPRAKLVPATQPEATATTSVKRKHKRHHAKKQHLPLKATPPLHVQRLVFPVAHGASWGDSYGGPRSDIANGWHHGDDLFAPLGTPVLAVATGTLSLVGWNQLGGWRLWLEDAAGNEYYYAHLAAYSRWILHHPHVRKGQVLGFLGRTGDAFTTPPHLHFEIHPKQLFKLGYDGAVDPTSYLRTMRIGWPKTKHLPKPARLKAPVGSPRVEASVVWRQLMAKRHAREAARRPVARALAAAHPPPRGDGSAHFPPPRRLQAVRLAARVAPRPAETRFPLVLLALILGASSVAGLLLRKLGSR